MDDSYHVPMKSWGMSVSATNINCVDSIFRSKYSYKSKTINIFNKIECGLTKKH